VNTQNRRSAEGGLLDATNLSLLEELQRDARTSLAELGRRVGLSSPAVAERLKHLENEGVITGYRAEVASAQARLQPRRDDPHQAGAAPVV